MCVTALDPPVIEGRNNGTVARRYTRRELSAVCEPGLVTRGHLLKVLPELLDIEFV